MATSATPSHLYQPAEADIYIGYASDITFSTNNSISGAFATSGTMIAAKNLTIVPPETPYEQQNLTGKDSNGFQNAILDKKPPGPATMTATLVLDQDEQVLNYFVSGAGVTTVTSDSTSYSRYQIGKSDTSPDLTMAVVFVNESTGKEVSFGFDNVKPSKFGDIRISGPDAHAELDIAVICLPKNFYAEFRD